MTHPERSGAEPGDRAAGRERIGGSFRAVKHFEAIADRVGKTIRSLTRRSAASAREPCATLIFSLEMRCEVFERKRVFDFPTVECRALAIGAIDHHPLLAIVHATQRGADPVFRRAAYREIGCNRFPSRRDFGPDPDVSQRLATSSQASWRSNPMHRSNFNMMNAVAKRPRCGCEHDPMKLTHHPPSLPGLTRQSILL